MEKNVGKQDNKITDIFEFAKINDETNLLKFCPEKTKNLVAKKNLLVLSYYLSFAFLEFFFIYVFNVFPRVH